MKKIYFVWVFIIVNASCTSKSIYSKQILSTDLIEKDSLENAARWELYKLNVFWIPTVQTPTVHGKTYEWCDHRFIPFVNYILDTFKVEKRQDTLNFLFNTSTPSCGDQISAQFVYSDGTTWYPYYGVRYVSGVQEGIYYGRVICKIKSEKDTLFANFLHWNRDSITNEWLLNYAQRFLKNK
jgi:hypothetical protein